MSRARKQEWQELAGRQLLSGCFWVGLLLFGLLISGCGCGSRTDEESIADLSLTTAQLCEHLSDGRLPPGQTCATVVQAREPYNVVGLHLEAGENYNITVPGNQTWWDWKRSNQAPRGEEGSWIMRLLPSHYKQAPQFQWFTLVADSTGHNSQHDLNASPDFIAVTAGWLVLYANDVPCLYCNNDGAIVVEIRRQ
jgi:hypothetical protein